MKAIMYHYVRPFDPEYPSFKNLHIDDFIQQLDYFEREYGFLSQEEFLTCLRTGTPSKGVVLTFDDGLHCHYNYVFEELKRRGLWGIFYISTQPYTEGRILDVHRTHLLLGKHDSKEIFHFLEKIIDDSFLNKSRMDEFEKLTYLIQENDEYALLVKRILNYFVSFEYREELVNTLMAHFIPDEDEILKSYYLTPSQIKEMHEAGMIIGSHTVNHPVMAMLDKKEQQRQIVDSFHYLEKIVDTFHHKTFCYPYGGYHSFTEETEEMLVKNGCLYSFNVEERDIESTDLITRPQALPRYDCNQFEFGQVRSMPQAGTV